MHIVVGLGNPGSQYASTRHNVGFMVVDEFVRRAAINHGAKSRFRSHLIDADVSDERVVVVKPQTYMNLSGHAVREVVRWYRLPVTSVIVVVDDLDLPLGTLRLRSSGSAGGHNGLRSIIDQLGTEDIPRLRIGIGRSDAPARNQVLSRFSSDELPLLPSIVTRAAAALVCWLEKGIVVCMNDVNQAMPPPRDESISNREVG